MQQSKQHEAELPGKYDNHPGWRDTVSIGQMSRNVPADGSNSRIHGVLALLSRIERLPHVE